MKAKTYSRKPSSSWVSLKATSRLLRCWIRVRIKTITGLIVSWTQKIINRQVDEGWCHLWLLECWSETEVLIYWVHRNSSRCSQIIVGSRVSIIFMILIQLAKGKKVNHNMLRVEYRCRHSLKKTRLWFLNLSNNCFKSSLWRELLRKCQSRLVAKNKCKALNMIQDRLLQKDSKLKTILLNINRHKFDQ